MGILDKILGILPSAAGGGPYQPLPGDLVAEYNRWRPAGPGRVLCRAPFTNLFFNRHGGVQACCHNTLGIMGTWPGRSIREIWTGEEARVLRNHLRHHDLSHGCSICMMDLERRLFPEVKAEHFDHFPEAGKFPKAMEFQLDTACNLECIMCSGEFSSAIRRHREKGETEKSPYDSRFIVELEPFLPHLSEARFNGGEPFLIGLYPEIWERLIRAAPECDLFVQTNGSVLPGGAREIVRKGKFHFGVSVNSLDKNRLEAIQKNCDHGTVMENIAFFHGECERKQTKLTLSACAMRENWEDLPGILEFANRLGAYMIFHTVTTPTRLSLWNLGSRHLTKIHDHLVRIDFPADTPSRRINRIHYQNLVGLIGMWRDDAIRREEKAGGAWEEDAPFQDLLVQKIAAYVRGEAGLGEERKSAKIRDLGNKIRDVANLVGERNLRKEGLRDILLLPTEVVVAELRMNTVETLFQKAMTYADRG